MLTLSIGLYLIFSFFISGILFIIPDLGLGPHAASYYSNLIQVISALVCAILCWRTMAIFKRSDPMYLVWLLMGAGVISWCIGEALYAGYIVLHNGEETPYPWFSDIGFLLIQPLIVMALLVFIRTVSVSPPTWGIALASVLLIIALIASFQFGYPNLLRASSSIESLAIIGYMLFDPILLATTVLTASLLTGGRLAYPWWFCSGGLILYYLSNRVFDLGKAQNLYVSGSWVDLGWPLSFTLIGVAAMLVYNMLHIED